MAYVSGHAAGGARLRELAVRGNPGSVRWHDVVPRRREVRPSRDHRGFAPTGGLRRGTRARPVGGGNLYAAGACPRRIRPTKRVIEQVCDAASRAVSDGKTPALLGGEHTITVGGVRACAQRHEDLSVLFLDAHGDLRDSFMGSRWGHASVARRVSEICPIVAVGVRSISAEEFEFAQDSRNAERVTLHSWPSPLDADALARRSERAPVSQRLCLDRPGRAGPGDHVRCRHA